MHFRLAHVFSHAVKVVIACVFLSLLSSPAVHAEQSTPPVQNLSEFPFDTHKKAILRGDWWFQFGTRLSPSEAVKAATSDQLGTQQVPLDWGLVVENIEQNPYAHGYATYVIQLTLPYSKDVSLVVAFPRVADAYDVFWVPANSPDKAEKIGGSGEMTGPIQSSTTKLAYPLDFQGDGYLVVHVRKEIQSYGGILRAPFIANAETYQTDIQMEHILDGLVMGITLFAAMLNSFLFLAHRKDPATLILAIAAFAFLLRSTILAGMFEIQFGPEVRSFRVRLEYAGILLIGWASFALHQTLLWRRFSDLSGPLVAGVIAMLGCAILFTAPLPVVTNNLVYVQLYCVVTFVLILATSFRAIVKRQEDAWFYTLGWLVPLLAALNDIVVSQTYSGVYLVNYAFVLFICAYSVKVGRRVTGAIGRAELLDRDRATLQQLHQDAVDTASRDHLTGLLNRQAYDNEVSLAWREKDFSDQGISLVLFDIDHFKAVNDTYGHPAGDDVLRAVSELVQGARLRRSDRVCRFGGEEFVLILPDTTCENAMVVAERIRHRIAAMTTTCSNNVSLRVTASFGLTCAAPNSDLDPTVVLQRAEEALLHAKNTGRNRSVSYDKMLEERDTVPPQDLKAAS